MAGVAVARARYRLRLCNGSNARVYELATGGPMIQIGSDGGLLSAPRTVKQIRLSPGGGADVVVDCPAYKLGQHVELRNLAGQGAHAKVTRDFEFSSGSVNGGVGWLINGRPFDPKHMEARPKRGDVELRDAQPVRHRYPGGAAEHGEQLHGGDLGSVSAELVPLAQVDDGRSGGLMPRSPRRATLATVAASAGVSVSTVSKVLNGRSDVAPATRSLVQSLLLEHGYVAPASGRWQAEPSAPVEVQVDGELCAYSSEIIKGAVEAGAEFGVAVVVATTTGMAGGASWARDLVAAGRRAMITLIKEPRPAQLAVLSRVSLPVVVIDPLNVPDTLVTSVGSTNFAGGLAATQHLLTLGHRRIAYLGGPATAASNQARMYGYRAAMEAAGVPVPPQYVRAAGYCHPDGLKEGAILLDLEPPPTAIFAASDESALGVIQAASARGLRVPEDLSVVGFDDSRIASMTSPQLTTVRQPLREMGLVALRTALRLAAGEKIESRHIELATELVVRGSSIALSLERESDS
ncbi:DNA-binding LacI/PurR family transcriptional regulator [Nonomuraea polychroma]|uniref:DNA-binding LacI/PurR family transcriptional regulator n=1 Tax=Nonomuraea polychroma TaxID=46176 RepID=A0A438M7Z5_9ACTN|nr:substrate-binding domain-containing protein [Nonomuraea polychroma]RVX41840.1 DNA-binding LacI/PurR family transcriptional regulator [Nonomuraea polychroma]